VQAAEIAATAKELKKDGDTYSGELTEEGAKALLRSGRGVATLPHRQQCKGSVKFWVKDGAPGQIRVQGQRHVSFNGNEFENDHSTTVEIKEVGTTKVEVPEAAKKKLT